MRITYRQVKMYLDCLSQDQLDCDLTIHMEGEAFPADFRILGQECADELGLETNHPVIYARHNVNDDRSTDEDIHDHIVRINQMSGFGPVGGD